MLAGRKIVAFLPVKGTSNRVPNKNTRAFNGEPFFVFTLRKLLRCGFIDEVYIDSESDAILEVGKRLGARILKRDPELASNKTDGHQLFANEVRHATADIYIQHLCTSPFVKESTIRQAVETLIERSDIDSVVLGKADRQYHWQDGKPTYNLAHIPNSVDLPEEHSEAMALYAVTAQAARDYGRRIGERPLMIFGDPTELIDVNTEDDLQLAMRVGAGILAEEEKKLRVIGRFLTTPILSDVMDSLGLSSVLAPGYAPNIPGAKIFGRARTLHIRCATEEDSPASIYEALNSYRHVVSNDIIVVKTDLPSLAYFGELNMSLSIRCGAVGAVIGGMTRDTRATANAGFPVFARGSYCKDIKGRGAVQSINEPIDLDGIPVHPTDLILADQDGIVVVPAQREAEVLGEALAVLKVENSIVADVCQDVDVNSLVDRYGFF